MRESFVLQPNFAHAPSELKIKKLSDDLFKLGQGSVSNASIYVK